jgi:hypothetical protein
MSIDQTVYLETEIRKLIREDNGAEVSFDYQPSAGKEVTLRVHTINPATKETFLLTTVYGEGHENALKALLNHVKIHKTENRSYTVKWRRKADTDVMWHTSYFYCKGLCELVERFYEGKDKDMYEVYEIKLNPVA